MLLRAMLTFWASLPSSSQPLPLFYRWQPILIEQYEERLVAYGVAAGVAFTLFYILLRRWMGRRKIQPSFPSSGDMGREILYSLLSMAVFAGIGLLTIIMKRLGLIHFYGSLDGWGWGYFVFSVLALIFLHDAWFYWMHRAMHWKPLFRLAHRVHHQSHNPTPWAAFAFHPIEAFLEGIFFPIVALFMPLHPLAIAIWLLYMIVMNVLGHLGYEILPAGFVRHPVFRWHNTPVHHNMHHSKVHCNYGLYFNIWDRLMGTNHAEYETHYDRATGVRPTPAAAKRVSEPVAIEVRAD